MGKGKRIMPVTERNFFYIYTVHKKPTRRNIGLVHCGSGGTSYCRKGRGCGRVMYTVKNV